LNLEYWRGKRVLVTGHTGFKGAWLTIWLHKLGAEVTGLSLEPENSCNLWSMFNLNGVRSIIVDINDQQAITAAIVECQPQIVFHLAAQSLVRRSCREPAQTFATNVSGTVNVLCAVAQCESVLSVVCATSDKCYENVEQIWGYRETDPMGGCDPYSASKGAAELAIASIRQSFFAPFIPDGHKAGIAAVRAGNVIGGGDWSEDRLVPDIVRGCLGEAGSVTLRAPNSIRPWQHVLEPLRGYLMIAENIARGQLGFAESWNFGPEKSDERTVIEVASAIVKALGKGEINIEDDTADLHEANTLRLDCTKSRVKIGWIPAMTFRDCIAFTADWYAGWAEGADAGDLCRAQIIKYQKFCKDFE
jgi:CDP-glucose 4,6-dehydratase